MNETANRGTPLTDESVIRILYRDQNQAEVAKILAQCLNEVDTEKRVITTTEYQPPPPNQLGGLELIIELVVVRITTRFIIHSFINGLLLFAEKFHLDPNTVFIVRLLFPEEKGKNFKRKKDFPLGTEIKKVLLDALQKSIEQELTGWLGVVEGKNSE